MLQVQNLQFAYSAQTRFEYPDFELEEGDSLLILGKSGSGKTTLLHLLAGFLASQEGEIWIAGKALHQQKLEICDNIRKQHIGLVFQKHHFVKSLHLLDNLLLAAKLSGQVIGKDQVISLMRELNIDHRAKALPAHCSQGELQRASIIRATLHSPLVVLADEPTSALDDESCEQVAKMLQQQCEQQQAALVMVTHDQRLKKRFNQIVQL